MASSRQWSLSPYDKRHTSSNFYSEHPGRSQTAGRQRHASGITRYPADRSLEHSTHRSYTKHSNSEGHGYTRHREHHADSVSLSRSRSRSRDRDYDDYGRNTHSSHYGSRHNSHSGSLANSQAYSHNEDRSRGRHRDLELSHSHSRSRDYDHERDRDRYSERSPHRDHDRSRSRAPSYREHEASRRRRRNDDSEYSDTSSNSRTDTSNGYSCSDRDNSRVYNSGGKHRERGASLRNERGRSNYKIRDRAKDSMTRSRMDFDSNPLTDPEEISGIAKFLLILSTAFTLAAYTLLILVGRGGWRSPNFWFELLFYLFILISILLYAFNVQRVVDFLSKNLPFATSRKGYTSILVFISIRSWPRTWPVDVTNQIEVHIAGNFFSLAGLVIAFSLYFVE